MVTDTDTDTIIDKDTEGVCAVNEKEHIIVVVRVQAAKANVCSQQQPQPFEVVIVDGHSYVIRVVVVLGLVVVTGDGRWYVMGAVIVQGLVLVTVDGRWYFHRSSSSNRRRALVCD